MIYQLLHPKELKQLTVATEVLTADQLQCDELPVSVILTFQVTFKKTPQNNNRKTGLMDLDFFNILSGSTVVFVCLWGFLKSTMKTRNYP